MPYDQILDSEVDPGSPITTGLIERLRDNPYSLASSIDIGGGIGVISECGRLASANPAVPSMFDSQGFGVVVSPLQYFLPIGGPLVATTSSIVALPRAPALCVRGWITTGVRLYNNSVSSPTDISPQWTMIGVFSGGVPTHLRLKNRKYVGSSSDLWPNNALGTLTGPLSAALSSMDVPLGGSWVTALTFSYVSTVFVIEVSATVDQDIFYVAFRHSRNVAAYSYSLVLPNQQVAGSIYTGTYYRTMPLLGS